MIDLDKRIAEVPPKFQRLYRRAVAGKASPLKAIRAKCQECMGHEGISGRSLADEITACTSIACPLYQYRQGKRPAHRCARPRLSSAKSAKAARSAPEP